MQLLGSIIYVTSAFYRFWSSLSTLDLSLFCIFIVQPDLNFARWNVP